MFGKILRSLDPILAIGVVLSVAVAIILVLTGQDQATSLLIGLAVTAITLLIDVLARLKNSEQRIVEAIELGEALSSDPRLFGVIRQIAQDYRAVKQLAFDHFSLRADDALLECREVIHHLVEGRMTVSTQSKYTYGFTGINTATHGIKAVAYADIAWWRSNPGETYMLLNIEAAKRGVDIIRVWIFNKDALAGYKDVIERQKQADIQTYVATPDQIPSDFLEDYMVVDERVLVKLELTLHGQSKAELISINPIEVDKALSNFDGILRYATPFDTFFAINT
ncbi:MAG: hypothetical protein AB1791_03445 [Chloroflexota bacterium]